MFDGMKNNGYSNIVLKTFGENSDNNLLKTMFTNGSIIYLQYVVLTVGDYWHFIKTQNYKCLNYKYNAIDDNYKCSGLNDKCKGKLNYSKGFIIEEKDQHNCVSERIYLNTFYINN
uniref:Plasmodium vivax Vir protein n=1 Tax=Meloidogyne hapla TaxID=6305 RepID=A0A1I8BVV3_MELHA